MRAADPGAEVELWCEDEARLGLRPVARRVWCPVGTRPTCNGRQRFGALYVYGFAHPASGRSRFVILPRADTAHMGRALADFAAWADPGGRKRLVVLVDNAGWHVAKALAVPANVVLHRLPSCTPELQPAERLWPLVREGLANRQLDDLAAVEAAVRARCDQLAADPELVRGPIGYHWATAA